MFALAKLPKANRDVIIITKEFRCMGFIDGDGHWRGMDGCEISDVIGWELFETKGNR